MQQPFSLFSQACEFALQFLAFAAQGIKCFVGRCCCAAETALVVVEFFEDAFEFHGLTANHFTGTFENIAGYLVALGNHQGVAGAGAPDLNRIFRL